jgi:hypothetical protein
MAFVAAGCALAACSAGSRSNDVSWGPPAEAMTRATLVGEMCERGEPCACRDEDSPGPGGVSGPDGPLAGDDGDGGDGDGGDQSGQADPSGAPSAAASEVKRLELRLRSSHDLWLRVGDLTFYKDRERLEACFYIDLPAPGIGERPRRQDVELRASNADGVSAELVINELGVAARSWYHTFRFSCGVPGACGFDELDGLKAAAQRAVRDQTLYDACGSIKVRDVRWDTRVAPDHEHPGDLTLKLTLDLLHLTPERRSGDPNCSLR